LQLSEAEQLQFADHENELEDDEAWNEMNDDIKSRPNVYYQIAQTDCCENLIIFMSFCVSLFDEQIVAVPNCTMACCTTMKITILSSNHV
jgi:hypothetical protein